MISPARLEKLEAVLVDVPTIRPHVLSVATMNSQTMVIARAYCSDGIIGTGEATTIGGLAYGEESPEGIKLTIDTYFAPRLNGVDVTRPAAAMAALNAVVVGNRFAKSAVEMALLDAAGSERDVGPEFRYQAGQLGIHSQGSKRHKHLHGRSPQDHSGGTSYFGRGRKRSSGRHQLQSALRLDPSERFRILPFQFPHARF